MSLPPVIKMIYIQLKFLKVIIDAGYKPNIRDIQQLINRS